MLIKIIKALFVMTGLISFMFLLTEDGINVSPYIIGGLCWLILLVFTKEEK